ncbi:hypothetical protein Mgra_00002487 [Meloidogyne graminicola]|uniref:lysoplasmalogenase n=1 Tax=Meloidogyne graminicola TaxID=189291 RepID=A0A8S9ZWC6_9BILA|nr:hypothetical protein Mgra_00002487 [Meloidogyne graminicola]
MSSLPNAHLLVIYFLLIAFFYDNTNGFNSEENRIKYSILKLLPLLFLAFAVHFINDSSQLKIKKDEVNTTKISNNFPKKHFISAALFSAAFGDFLISALPNPHLAFSFGAIAFGFCHIFYMFEYFQRIKRICLKILIPIYLYNLIICYYFLIPKINEHPFVISTLIIYSLILSTAIISSSSLALETKKMKDILRFIGYIFFFISDSLLLLEYAGLGPINEVIVLSTYYISQYSIMESSLIIRTIKIN